MVILNSSNCLPLKFCRGNQQFRWRSDFKKSVFGILITFTGGLAVALVFGYFAHRVKLSPIIGYLLAGVVVGPFTPGFVAVIAAAQYNKFQLRSLALERHTLRGQGFLDTQGRVFYTSSQKKEVLINAFNN